MRHTISDTIRGRSRRLHRSAAGARRLSREQRSRPENTAREQRSRPGRSSGPSPNRAVHLDPVDPFAAAEAALQAAGIDFAVVACPVRPDGTHARQAAA